MKGTSHQEDHARLRGLCDRWRGSLAGRVLHRVQGGPGWVRVLLAGEERLSLLLVARPGCALGLLWQGKLPESVDALMERRKDHPLADLLADHTLNDCRVLKEDRVLCLRLSSPDGRPVTLLHQVFGTKGNLVLLSTGGRLLWAEHRPPHSLLTRVPGPEDLAALPTGSASWAGAEANDDAMKRLAQNLADDFLRRMAGPLQRRQQAGVRLVENLARDLSVAERGDEFRRKAEALAAHLHEIKPGLTHCRVDDPRDGTPLDIELDPGLKPSANLTAWFKRASKADKGHQIISERLQDARLQLQENTANLMSLEAVPTGDGAPLTRLDNLLAWGRAHPDLMPVSGGARRHTRSPFGPDQPARPFRRYRVEDQWEVWIGRDSKENDALTHRSSHLQDIWLHAQGVTGSHVILRTGGRPDQVPQRVLLKAAALAALFSKARNANLVPVIWTERRFVRKPRKGAPGLAVCLREKSLMVTPGVGQDVVPI